MLDLVRTTQFKKDYKLVENSKAYKKARECHINPDWLLIYRIEKDTLILELIRTGSHSDLY
jgi:mRNA interferase YafQ